MHHSENSHAPYTNIASQSILADRSFLSTSFRQPAWRYRQAPRPGREQFERFQNQCWSETGLANWGRKLCKTSRTERWIFRQRFYQNSYAQEFAAVGEGPAHGWLRPKSG